MARLVENEIGKMQKYFTKQIKKEYKNAIKKAAKEIQQTLVNKYVSIIADFYADKVFTTNNGNPTRNPRTYHRTYNLYSGLTRVYKETNDSIETGISLSGNNIAHQYRADNDWVYQRAFELGIHGFARPHMSIDGSSKETVDMVQYDDTYITSYKHVPRLTNPPPIYHMDVEYNKITNNKNLYKLVRENL